MERLQLRMGEVMDHYGRGSSSRVYGSDVRPCDLCKRMLEPGDRVVLYTLRSKNFTPPMGTPYVVQVCEDCEGVMLASR